MSDALYEFGGLRFWTEDEIELRETFQLRIASVVRRTLLMTNPAWRIVRTEGPILTPASRINPAYGERDVFFTTHKKGGEILALRAETTESSYAFARHLGGKLPLCVWQAGKSFRTEMNDGASAAKLRFNEFWQIEFQCIYRNDTKADYRAAVLPSVADEIARFTQRAVRQVESDRLPSYSESTLDLEVEQDEGVWREMASCSIRTDFAADVRVCEIAIGLDRVAAIAAAIRRMK